MACVLLPRPQPVAPRPPSVVFAAAVGGMLFAPAAALLSDGAEAAGLPQGIVFGLFNLAWAGGQVAGAAGGARVADATTDSVPYLVVGVLAVASLVALFSARSRGRPEKTATSPVGGRGGSSARTIRAEP